MENDVKKFVTSDLSLAAFLTMRGLELLRCGKTQIGKFEFIFLDKDEVGSKYSIEYLNSDFCKFDHHVRSIKKMLYKN
jgi:hypothetical protein